MRIALELSEILHEGLASRELTSRMKACRPTRTFTGITTCDTDFDSCTASNPPRKLMCWA